MDLRGRRAGAARNPPPPLAQIASPNGVPDRDAGACSSFLHGTEHDKEVGKDCASVSGLPQCLAHGSPTLDPGW
jgi:hypothetical protein